MARLGQRQAGLLVSFYSISFALHIFLYQARPALPTCRISPVRASSLRRTGQDAPSALAKDSSSFVPRTLQLDLSVSMGPNSGNSAAYRFGGLSLVVRSRTSCLGWKSTLAVSFLIFFRNIDAMTWVGVW